MAFAPSSLILTNNFLPLNEALCGNQSMELVAPSEKYQQSYNSYIKELGGEQRYPFTMGLEHQNFEHLLIQLNDFSLGNNLPSGVVQNSTFWLVEQSELIGVTNVRHHLNPRIEYCGGHIGLGIRPSFRGKGLGNLLMKLSIKQLVNLDVNPIHVHCYKNNTASAKAIQNNGGIINSEITESNEVIQRYCVFTT